MEFNYISVMEPQAGGRVITWWDGEYVIFLKVLQIYK